MNRAARRRHGRRNRDRIPTAPEHVYACRFGWFATEKEQHEACQATHDQLLAELAAAGRARYSPVQWRIWTPEQAFVVLADTHPGHEGDDLRDLLTNHGGFLVVAMCQAARP